MVATDLLVLKLQDISIHSADEIIIILYWTSFIPKHYIWSEQHWKIKLHLGQKMTWLFKSIYSCFSTPYGGGNTYQHPNARNRGGDRGGYNNRSHDDRGPSNYRGGGGGRNVPRGGGSGRNARNNYMQQQGRRGNFSRDGWYKVVVGSSVWGVSHLNPLAPVKREFCFENVNFGGNFYHHPSSQAVGWLGCCFPTVVKTLMLIVFNFLH